MSQYFVGQQVVSVPCCHFGLRLPHAVALPSSNSILYSILAIPTTENQREILTWAWHCHTTHTIHSEKLMTKFYLNARELWNAVCVSHRRRSGSSDHLSSPWPSHCRLLFKCHLLFYLAKIGQDTSSSWQLSKVSCVLQSDWLTKSLTWSI